MSSRQAGFLAVGLLVAFATATTPAAAQRSCAEWASEFYPVPGTNGDVHVVREANLGSGPSLFVGGNFDVAGNVPRAGGIARWEGDRFFPLGSGLRRSGGQHGVVQAIAMWNDGTGRKLYVGGSFETAGGVPASNVARWDGSSWTALGDGVTGVVRDIKVFDDGTGPALYVAGVLSAAGGIAVRNIARWDGAAWSPVVLGLNGSLTDLQVFDDGSGPVLLAAGGFLWGGPPIRGGVARFDGRRWTFLGDGFDDEVSAITVVDDGSGPTLFAVGPFRTADGAPAVRAARWDGARWSRLGSGVPGTPYAAISHDDGTGQALYVGGDFSFPGMRGIVRWDGSAWSGADGSGFGAGFVRALGAFESPGGRVLAVGGTFSSAGGGVAHNFASYDGAVIRSLVPYLASAATALAFFDDGSGPTLYASASLHAGESGPLRFLVRREGSGWRLLGGGREARVRAMIAFDDGSGPALFVGGDPGAAGGAPVSTIHGWNGDGWSVPGGVPSLDVVNGFAVFDDGTGPRLHAGHGPGAAGLGIASWDGTAWIGLEGPVTGTVSCLRSLNVPEGEALFACGRFNFTGDTRVFGVLKWNGAEFSSVGEPGEVSSAIKDIVVFDFGSGPELVAAGEMRFPGSDSIRPVARFDGERWHPFDDGLDLSRPEFDARLASPFSETGPRAGFSSRAPSGTKPASRATSPTGMASGGTRPSPGRAAKEAPGACFSSREQARECRRSLSAGRSRRSTDAWPTTSLGSTTRVRMPAWGT